MPEGLYLTDLFYIGNDTLPFKMIENLYDLTGGNTYEPDTGYYFYKNGKLASDSVTYDYNPSGYLVYSYTYENNTVIITHLDASTPPTVSVNKHYLTKTNGNTTSQIDSIFTNGVSYGISEATFSASYDTKKNPFYNLVSNLENIPLSIYGLETLGEDMTNEKNNPIEIISGFHLKYVYEYNPSGYPSIARIYNIEGPSEFWFKRIFIYTKL